MVETLEYPYKINIKKLALLLPFIGGLAYFMAHLALTNDRGMVLFRLIHLEKEGATVVFWGLAAIIGAGTVAGVIAIVTQLQAGEASYIRVAEDGFSIPVGFFEKRMQFVPFTDVTGLKLMSVQNENYLVIRHAGGKISLQQSALPGAEPFQKVAAAIIARSPKPVA